MGVEILITDLEAYLDRDASFPALGCRPAAGRLRGYVESAVFGCEQPPTFWTKTVQRWIGCAEIEVGCWPLLWFSGLRSVGVIRETSRDARRCLNFHRSFG